MLSLPVKKNPIEVDIRDEAVELFGSSSTPSFLEICSRHGPA